MMGDRLRGTLLLGASEMGLGLVTELDGDAMPVDVRPTSAGRRFTELVAAAWSRRRPPASSS